MGAVLRVPARGGGRAYRDLLCCELARAGFGGRGGSNIRAVEWPNHYDHDGYKFMVLPVHCSVKSQFGPRPGPGRVSARGLVMFERI